MNIPALVRSVFLLARSRGVHRLEQKPDAILYPDVLKTEPLCALTRHPCQSHSLFFPSPFLSFPRGPYIPCCAVARGITRCSGLSSVLRTVQLQGKSPTLYWLLLVRPPRKRDSAEEPYAPIRLTRTICLALRWTGSHGWSAFSSAIITIIARVPNNNRSVMHARLQVNMHIAA